MLPKVIFPLIKLASFCVSAIAAIGIDQVAKGPQKCVLKNFKDRKKNEFKQLQCYSI
jgi:hypothetical protein